MTDFINPAHYKDGRRFEVIDLIEDNICRTDDPVCAFLQGQILRYVCRMWDKSDPLEDLQKAEWYLQRLKAQLSEDDSPVPFNFDFNYEDVIKFSDWKSDNDDQLILG